MLAGWAFCHLSHTPSLARDINEKLQIIEFNEYQGSYKVVWNRSKSVRNTSASLPQLLCRCKGESDYRP
jgi:hypothetical protein